MNINELCDKITIGLKYCLVSQASGTYGIDKLIANY